MLFRLPSAVCRLPSAVCRLPSAVCRLPSAVIIAIRCLKPVVGLVFWGCLISPVTQAAVENCGAQTGYERPIFLAIVTPMEFDSMPNGSLVSQSFYKRLEVICTANPMDWVGIRLLDVPGAKVVSGVTLKHYLTESYEYESVIYTTSELERRGLGFVIGDHSANFSARVYCYIGSEPIGDGHTSLIVAGDGLRPRRSSIFWARVPTGCGFGSYPVPNGSRIRFEGSFSLSFVKIGNSSQHARLPQNVSIPLFQVAMYNKPPFGWTAVGTAAASITMAWNVTGFSSWVIRRTCTTPQASQSLIDFGHFTVEDWQVPAGSKKAQREFTLTFNCPGAGYEYISFFVEPKYGMAAGTYGNNGVMKIATGAGMARGVGVKLEVCHTPYTICSVDYEPVVYRTDLTSVEQRKGKYFLEMFRFSDGIPIDPRTYPFKQQQVKFRASLIRLPEPLVAGQIKAAALIHIRYN